MQIVPLLSQATHFPIKHVHMQLRILLLKLPILVLAKHFHHVLYHYLFLVFHENP